MLFLREILAFMQILFLPGILILGLIRPRLGFFRGAILACGLSGILNYLFVYAAFHFGFWNRWSVFLFLFVELVLLILVWRRAIMDFFLTIPMARFHLYIVNTVDNLLLWWKTQRVWGQILMEVAGIGVLLGLSWWLSWFLNAWDNVFCVWDAALSWNRWACEWYDGIFPTRSYQYPQMVPANWALAYQIIGEKIQFVSKFSISIFPLLTLLLLTQRGIAKRSFPFFCSVPILAWFFHNVEYERFGADLDLLIAFYSVSAYLCILYAQDADTRREFTGRLLLCSLLVCACTITKQAGWYLVAVMPVMAFWILRGKSSQLFPGKTTGFWIRSILVHCALVALIVAPYYAQIQYRIKTGQSHSNVRFVTEQIYGGKTHLDRFLISGRLFLVKMQAGAAGVQSARWTDLHKEKGYLWALLELYAHHIVIGMLLLGANLVLLYSAWKSREFRPPLVLIVIPYTLIWSIFYCYDLRNLSLAIPMISLCLSAGFCRLSDTNASLKILHWRTYTWLLIGAFLFFAARPENWYDHHRQKLHASKRLEIGVPALNKKLAQYHEEHGLNGKIATDYEYFNLIPGMEGLLHYEEFSTRTDAEWESYCSLFSNPDVGYMLIPSYTMERIHNDVVQRMKKGELELFFREDIYQFYQIKRANKGTK